MKSQSGLMCLFTLGLMVLFFARWHLHTALVCSSFGLDLVPVNILYREIKVFL